jgi:hypothetical protein
LTAALFLHEFGTRRAHGASADSPGDAPGCRIGSFLRGADPAISLRHPAQIEEGRA